jgi:hypothetical protein
MEAGISVKRFVTLAPIALLALAGGCERARQGETAENQAITIDIPRAASEQPGVTPMAQRVAVIGLLNKRNGIVRDLTLRPGQAMRVKDVTVRLRACETSAPWEQEKLTGAFVQVDRLRPDGKWVRRFSGWLYKESPSLNVVEDPVYDVWPKSCAMNWPAGPAAPAAPSGSSSRSSASKSGGGSEGEELLPSNGNATAPVEEAPAPEPPPAESAEPSNPT